MDLGTVSSWVAAAISFASAGGAVLWSWWNRPKVDWLFTGKIVNPSQDRQQLVIRGECGNFGDGNAHRVSVWILRSPAVEAQRIATTPLLRPGETMAFEATMHVGSLDRAEVFARWTPAPIRRRNERTSDSFLARDVFELSSLVVEADQKYRSSLG